MKVHYGYSNGSGDFYIVIDAAQCDGCGNCVVKCPQKALELQTVMIDLEDKSVAAVKEEHRKKIKYTCSPCRPDEGKAPCIAACRNRAICNVWKISEK